MMKGPVISSSELSSYEYCALSWHLQRLETPVPEDMAEANSARLEGGAALHDRHAGVARRIELKEKVSKSLLIAAILAGIIYLLGRVLI